MILGLIVTVSTIMSFSSLIIGHIAQRFLELLPFVNEILPLFAMSTLKHKNVLLKFQNYPYHLVASRVIALCS